MLARCRRLLESDEEGGGEVRQRKIRRGEKRVGEGARVKGMIKVRTSFHELPGGK